jgi:energy-coupling factor transport system permease protein
VLAISTAAAAVIIGGVAGPLLLGALAIILPAAVAGIVPRLLRFALIFSLPIAISALLVNLFFFPGGQEVLLRLGPITATAEGLAFAIEILVRIAAISGAITLFYLTTRPAELVLDLEGRGVPARLAFVANASVQTVPAMADRAQAIIAAQRARGLDTEGSISKRLRGLVPVAGPVILGSIAEVEERSMALEARAFTRPGRRSLLWRPPDSGIQRAARWLMVGGLVALVAARAGGWLA